MTQYEGEVAALIRRSGGDDLLERLSNADLSGMLDAPTKRGRRIARSFEEDLVDVHRIDLALLFAQEGARLIWNDPRHETHLNVSVDRDLKPLDRRLWTRRATSHQDRAKPLSSDYLPLLGRCLSAGDQTPTPRELFNSALRLAPSDAFRISCGIEMRIRGKYRAAEALHRNVLAGHPDEMYRSYAWHGVGIAQLGAGAPDLAVDSFRNAATTLELRPIPVCYWLALGLELGMRDEASKAARCLDEMLDETHHVLGQAVEGIRSLATIGAWPKRRKADRQQLLNAIGPATRRIIDGMV